MYPTINDSRPLDGRFAIRRGVPPYGLIDAFEHPQLTPIAEVLRTAARTDRSPTAGISPLRQLAGQVGLLDAFGGTEPALVAVRVPAERTLRFARRHALRPVDDQQTISTRSSLGRHQHSGAPRAEAGESPFADIGERVVDAFAQAGKDIWTGYRIGASGMYDTLGDAVGLINRANDFMTDWTGYGHMSEGTMWKDAENWLYDAAAHVAPAEEEMPTTLLGKGYAAVGQAPAELAQYLTAARWLGPIAGLASINAIRASEDGLGAAAGAAAKGAIFGTAAKALDPLSRIERSAGLGGLAAASTFGSSRDPLHDAVLYGLFGAAGVPRIPQKNLVPLRRAYDEFTDAASIADARLAVIKALSQKRQQQLRVGINRVPGVQLQDVARRSDELRGYTTTRGKRYELPDDPRFLDSRVFDYGRYKWWWLKRAEDAEVKREHAKDPKPQREANKHLKENEGVVIARRRENEILRRARVQLGREGRFDIQARDLGRAVRTKLHR